MRYICYSLFLVFICSCDSTIKILGQVVDKETNRPIYGATVNLLDGRDIKKSSDAGYFEVIDIGGIATDPIISVKQKGYKPFQLKIKSSDSEIKYIVKSESIWIKYDKPFYPDSTNRNTYVKGTWVNKWSQDFVVGDTLIIFLTKENYSDEIEKSKSNYK